MSTKTSIASLLDFYRQERRLFARCPCCGEAFRLSDLKITYGKEPPRDALTAMKRERIRLTNRIADLEEALEQQSDEHESAVAELRSQHDVKVEQEVAQKVERLVKDAREDAIERSRQTVLGKTLERIAPMFSGFGHHPADVRPIFEPVDFLVFTGLYSGSVSELVFVEFKTGNAALNPKQKSIRAAVEQRRVRFEERRINAETMRRLCAGAELPAGQSVVSLHRR